MGRGGSLRGLLISGLDRDGCHVLEPIYDGLILWGFFLLHLSLMTMRSISRLGRCVVVEYRHEATMDQINAMGMLCSSIFCLSNRRSKDVYAKGSALGCIRHERFQKQLFIQRKETDSRAAGIAKGRVQLAAHMRWDPEEGLDEVLAVGVPDVLLVVEDGFGPLACVATVVLALMGAEALTARLARKTFKALNSCPRPVFPSYLLSVQWVPQVVPLWPPEHCFAAPFAEV